MSSLYPELYLYFVTSAQDSSQCCTYIMEQKAITQQLVLMLKAWSPVSFASSGYMPLK